MPIRNNVYFLLFSICLGGCVTQKETYTARTGVEQLLISSAVDQSLAKVDFSPLQHRKVFLETKYLDCVDKNYIIVAMHKHLMAIDAALVDKPDEAQIIVEICSGAVGTDAQDMFVGVPEIPLAPPSPVAIPKLAFFTRNKMNGTAKLLVVAYDAKTKKPVINAGSTLARSDLKSWNLLATGTVQSGSVPEEIAKATGETDFNVVTVANMSKKAVVNTVTGGPEPTNVRPAVYMVSPPPAVYTVPPPDDVPGPSSMGGGVGGGKAPRIINPPPILDLDKKDE